MRKTRTLSQIAGFVTLICVLIFLADSRYRVLPSSIHSALPNHHAGTVVTDVTISFCSSLNPLSSCRLDPKQWHRIEKDLYLQSGWLKSAWLHVQRKKEEELTTEDRIIVGVRIGRLDPGVGEKGQQAEKWESRPGGLWILRSNKKHDSDSDKAITSVDVLFGADAVEPRPGWTLAQTPLLIESDRKLQPARLTTRHGQAHAEHKDAVPRVRKDGKFKILQVSDLHLATGTGTCRDAIGEGGKASTNCEADTRTLEFLESVLDSETPDLVVFSGDQVEGPQAPDTQSAIFKFAEPLIERSIPYASIFGNHDDETNRLSRSAQMSLLQTLPFNLAQPGPPEIDGIGNYHIEVLAAHSEHSALTLYFLDTHSLSPDEKNHKGYDWLKHSQIDWFKTTAQDLVKEHAKYSHIHLDMAFIHIPLPEYADKSNLIAGGEWKEPVTAPTLNTHFYDALVEAGVVAVGCGHDHVNDYCALRPAAPTPEHASTDHHNAKPALGPWMCYAGASGFGGYAGYGGFHRRVRVWEVDTNSGRVVTWKRVECCGKDTEKRIDELVIVDGGRVVAPPAA